MSHSLERLYHALPVGAQHLICSAEGLRLQWRRSGRAFNRLLRDGEARDAMSAHELVTLRDTLFRDFVSDAAAGSTFYRNQAAFRPVAEGRPFRAGDLPILDKRTVQADAPRIARADVRSVQFSSTS